MVGVVRVLGRKTGRGGFGGVVVVVGWEGGFGRRRGGCRGVGSLGELRGGLRARGGIVEAENGGQHLKVGCDIFGDIFENLHSPHLALLLSPRPADLVRVIQHS